MIKKTIRRGYNAVFGRAKHASAEGSKKAIADYRIPEKLDEVLFHLNRVNNAVTFKTGPYEALTRIFTGQKMYIDTRDISVAPHLMMDGHWEPEITKVFRELITPDAVVFDIGANFGYFGIVAGTEIANGKGHIHFFEANPELAPFMFKSAAINGLVHHSPIVSKAVSDKPGTVELTILEGFWGSSGLDLSGVAMKSVAGRTLDVREKVKVPAITIDDYVKENKIPAVDVIKIDIEGHEEAAYKGMRQTIKKSPSLIMLIEFTLASYKNPEKFFAQIQKDFGHIYAITNDNGGSLSEITDYKDLQKRMQDTWIMLAASKKPLS